MRHSIRQQKRRSKKTNRRLSICEQLESRQLMAADLLDAAPAPAIYDALVDLHADAQDGTVELSGIGLGPVTLEHASVTPSSGTVTGRFAIQTGEATGFTADVLVQCLDDCIIGMQVGDQNLAELLPFEGIADHLEIQTPILAYGSGENAEFDSRDLPEAAYDFWSQLYRDDQFTVRVNNGLNVMTAAAVAPESPVQDVLSGVGITLPELQLEGVLLEEFESAALADAESQPGLWERIREDWTLRATLDGFGLELPTGFSSGDAYLEATGHQTIAVGFNLDVPEADGDVLSFDVKGQLAFQDAGPPEVRFVGNMEGTWNSPLGIEGVDLTSGTLVMSFDPATQAVGFGLGGDMQIGNKQLSLAGKVELNVVTGAPVRAMFEGELDSLTDDDLVAFVNGVSSAADRQLLSTDALPDFELRNLRLTIAPLGGDADLGIEDGLGLAGELYVSGTLVGFVDGQVDAFSDEPSLSLEAWADELQLGELSLDDPTADISVDTASPEDAHFIISGVAELFGSVTTVDVNLSPEQMYFSVAQTVHGLYDAYFEYRSPIANDPVWTFTAEVTNEMGAGVETTIAGEINEMGEAALAAVNSAQAGVEVAQRHVDDLNDDLRRALDDAQREYDAVNNDLAKAKAAVTAAERYVSSWSRTVNSRHNAWRRAISATNRAAWWRKPYYKSVEAGKYASYRAAQAQRSAASVALSAARSTLGVVQRSAGWALDAVGPEAHPNVLRIKASLATANVALSAARGVLATAEDAADVAAVYQFDTLMIDRVYFQGVLVDYERALRNGNVDALNDSRVEFQVDYRWLGERERFRIFATTEEFGPEMLVDALTELLPV